MYYSLCAVYLHMQVFTFLLTYHCFNPRTNRALCFAVVYFCTQVFNVFTFARREVIQCRFWTHASIFVLDILWHPKLSLVLTFPCTSSLWKVDWFACERMCLSLPQQYFSNLLLFFLFYNSKCYQTWIKSVILVHLEEIRSCWNMCYGVISNLEGGIVICSNI